MGQRDRRVVLFVCTGNYYRSRYAELFFNSVAGKMGLPWLATSRGLALERGVNNVGPLAAEAATALAAHGVRPTIDSTRAPAQAVVADFEQAQRVVVLKRDEHWPLMQERFPAWAEGVEYWHIDDAPGVLPEIEREVMALIARLLGGGGAAPPEAPPVKVAAPAAKPIAVKVGRETKGRRGKGVTTVFDVPVSAAKLAELATLLKQRIGTGGTVAEGRIEIQGDQRERVAAELAKLGYKVKRVGG